MPAREDPTIAAERRIKAVELRSMGASYRQIGAQLGVSHEQARKDVMAGLRAAHKELASKSLEFIALELERLEAPILALAPAVKAGDTQAIETWRRLSESRRKLLGLDAPDKVAPTTPDGKQSYRPLSEGERHAGIAAVLARLGSADGGSLANGNGHANGTIVDRPQLDLDGREPDA